MAQKIQKTNVCRLLDAAGIAYELIEAARIIQPKVLFPYHYSQTDVSGIAAQLPDIDVRIRHYE
jgi:hypothetical protein